MNKKLLLLEKNSRQEIDKIKFYLKSVNIDVLQIQTEDLFIDINNSQIIYKNEPLQVSEFDGLFIRTYQQMDVLRFIAEKFRSKPIIGLDPFSSHFQNNKTSDLIALKVNSINIPNTYINYIPKEKEILVKDNWGFGGFGVKLYQKNEKVDFYSSHLQEFITSEKRCDWRVLIVNGKPVNYLIERFACEEDFRTNRHQGGTFLIHDSNHKLYKDLAHIATLAAGVLQRPFAGVDLRVDLEGNIFVLEVNRTPRLRFDDFFDEIYFSFLKNEINQLLNNPE